MNTYKSPKETLKTMNIFAAYLKKYYFDLPQPIRSSAFNLMLNTRSEIEKTKKEIAAYNFKKELEKDRQINFFS